MSIKRETLYFDLHNSSRDVQELELLDATFLNRLSYRIQDSVCLIDSMTKEFSDDRLLSVTVEGYPLNPRADIRKCVENTLEEIKKVKESTMEDSVQYNKTPATKSIIVAGLIETLQQLPPDCNLSVRIPGYIDIYSSDNQKQIGHIDFAGKQLALLGKHAFRWQHI